MLSHHFLSPVPVTTAVGAEHLRRGSVWRPSGLAAHTYTSFYAGSTTSTVKCISGSSFSVSSSRTTRRFGSSGPVWITEPGGPVGPAELTCAEHGPRRSLRAGGAARATMVDAAADGA